jgi:hypothetical protein
VTGRGGAIISPQQAAKHQQALGRFTYSWLLTNP